MSERGAVKLREKGASVIKKVAGPLGGLTMSLATSAVLGDAGQSLSSVVGLGWAFSCLKL